MAFAAAVGAAKVVGPLLNFAISTKKATDVLAEMKELPGEGYVLWKMMQCTEVPLNICTELAARHETLPYVEAAVALTRRTIVDCERLLESNDSEDERPECAASWLSWFGEKKDGIERRQLVKEVCSRLAMSQQALQLALQAVAFRFPGAAQHQQWDSFRYLPAAVSRAVELVVQFEMGRRPRQRLCFARRWAHAGSATRRAAMDWCSTGLVEVELVLTTTAGAVVGTAAAAGDGAAQQQHRFALLLTSAEGEEDEDHSGGDSGGEPGNSAPQSKHEVAEHLAGLTISAAPAAASSAAAAEGTQFLLGEDLSFQRGPLGGFVGHDTLCSDTGGDNEVAGGANALAWSLQGAGQRQQQCCLALVAGASDGVSAESIEALVALLCYLPGKNGMLEPQIGTIFDQTTEDSTAEASVTPRRQGGSVTTTPRSSSRGDGRRRGGGRSSSSTGAEKEGPPLRDLLRRIGPYVVDDGGDDGSGGAEGVSGGSREARLTSLMATPR